MRLLTPLLAAAAAGTIALGAALPWLIVPSGAVSGLAREGAGLVASSSLALLATAYALRVGSSASRMTLALGLLIAAETGHDLAKALLSILDPRHATEASLGPGLPIVAFGVMALVWISANRTWPDGRRDAVTAKACRVVAAAVILQTAALAADLQAHATHANADVWHAGIVISELIAILAVAFCVADRALGELPVLARRLKAARART